MRQPVWFVNWEQRPVTVISNKLWTFIFFTRSPKFNSISPNKQSISCFFRSSFASIDFISFRRDWNSEVMVWRTLSWISLNRGNNNSTLSNSGPIAISANVMRGAFLLILNSKSWTRRRANAFGFCLFAFFIPNWNLCDNKEGNHHRSYIMKFSDALVDLYLQNLSYFTLCGFGKLEQWIEGCSDFCFGRLKGRCNIPQHTLDCRIPFWSEFL